MTANPNGPPGVAVVTGASGGVGRALVAGLARRGHDVALLARGEAGLAGAAGDVRAAGRRALALPVDVADWHAVDVAASRIEAELGPVELWINDAMATVFGWSWETSAAEYRRSLEVTYLGQVHGTLAALARFRPRDRGRILNVGSSLAYVGIPLQAPYCSAKFAARGFTESVQAELLHTGSNVKLTMVHLPAVNTPQFDWCATHLDTAPQPVPPIYEPERIADAILVAADRMDRARVVGAWNKLVVLGARLAPGVVCRFAARGAVDDQVGPIPIGPGRPSNLWEPADEATDFGARGRSSDRAHGVLTGRFLRSLPDVARQLAAAVAGSARSAL